MKCSICGSKMGVVHTTAMSFKVVRLRRCVSCGAEMATSEERLPDAFKYWSLVNDVRGARRAEAPEA